MSKPTGKRANIVIYCSDPRVVRWLHKKDFREKLSIDSGSFSSISATGSIKFFMNENLMDKLYKQLDILVGHFSPAKIIILNHTDCGYYKSLGQNEEKYYLDDLKTSSLEISQKYPKLKVEGYLLDTETGELKNS